MLLVLLILFLVLFLFPLLKRFYLSLDLLHLKWVIVHLTPGLELPLLDKHQWVLHHFEKSLILGCCIYVAPDTRYNFLPLVIFLLHIFETFN